MIFSRRDDIRDEIIRAQQKQIADLLDRLQEMIGQIHLHQVQRAEATLDPSTPPYVTDEELDVRHAAAVGGFDEAELKKRLAEIDMETQFNSLDPSSMF